MTYEVEISPCIPGTENETIEVDSIQGVIEKISTLRTHAPVSVLIAVIGNNVDFGNFIFYLNEHDRGHVIVHEHRGFEVAEKAGFQNETVEFIAEDLSTFSVPSQKTMSFERVLFCLKSWLPKQEHSGDFLWLET